MENHRPTLALIAIILLFAALLVGATWANFRYILQDSGANSFTPRWVGARRFLVDGWSPYSQETMYESQDLLYGRPARLGEDQGAFLYPFYAVLVYSPYGLVGDHILARALWMTTLEVALLGVAVISVNLTRWRPAPWIWAILFLFALGWYPSVLALLNGSYVIVSALFILLALLAVRTRHDAVAGFLLALATMGALSILLAVFFICLWAISQRRWTVLWGLVGTLGIFIGISSLLAPDWILPYVRQVYLHFVGTKGSTPGDIVAHWLPGIGMQLGWAMTGLMIVALGWEWRAALRQDFRWFLWTTCLTLVISNLIGIRTSLENFVLLLPALILILAVWDGRWGKLGRILVIASLALLSIGLWGLTIYGVREGLPPDLDPALFFLPPSGILLGLYWVRWWAIHPQGLPLEVFRRRAR